MKNGNPSNEIAARSSGAAGTDGGGTGTEAAAKAGTGVNLNERPPSDLAGAPGELTELEVAQKGNGQVVGGQVPIWGLGSYLESVTKYFAVAAALVYATGFLVESAFLDRFGVTGAGVDFLEGEVPPGGAAVHTFPVRFCGASVRILPLEEASEHGHSNAQNGDFRHRQRSLGLLLVCRVLRSRVSSIRRGNGLWGCSPGSS